MTTQTITLTQRAQQLKQSSVAAAAHQTTPATTSSSHRVPAVKPPFTVGDIRRAVPAHCWQHSYVKSFAYLAADTAGAATLFYLSTFIDSTFSNQLCFNSPFLGFLVRHALWTSYWISQGIIFTGLWVIGHECGHGGFSSSERVNDIVGYVVHSFLMVPYFSWKISHRRHHSNTGNIERDEVFVPDVDYDRHAPAGSDKVSQGVSETIPDETDNYAVDSWNQLAGVATRLFWLTVMLTLGWPAYLAMNVSSNKSYPADQWVSHFNPNSAIFKSSKLFGREPAGQDKLVLLSDIGMVCMGGLLWKLSSVYGFSTVCYTFILPLMQNIMWLIIYTFLQHTDKKLPHYDSSEWDWLRGALATVDRDYGILNVFHHHIGDTHIVHHMFHQMPFYHAQEATEAVKPVLKEYYTMDRTPIAKALWNNYGECVTVSPDASHKGVYWYN